MESMVSSERGDGGDWCRHCGAGARMTEEHLPPRSTGNKGAIRGWTDADVDPVDASVVQEAIRTWPDGHTVPTLCDPCNAKPSSWKYVLEYGRWRDFFVEAMRIHVTETGSDPFRAGRNHDVELPYDFNPRRFAGQIAGMFLAAQRYPVLREGNPGLVEAVGGGLSRDEGPPGGVDVAPVDLRLGLGNADFVFSQNTAILGTTTAAGPRPSGLLVPVPTTVTTSYQVGLFAPFVFTLVESGPTPPWPSISITGWLQLGHHDRLSKQHRKIRVPVGLPPASAIGG